MRKIEAFRASDGALFADEESCLAHETLIRWAPLIEKFCDSESSPFRSAMHRTMAKKIVLAWEKFKAAGNDAARWQTPSHDRPAIRK